METMSIVDLGRTAFQWDSNVKNKDKKTFSFRESGNSPDSKKGKKVSYEQFDKNNEEVDEIEVKTEDMEELNDS